MTKVTPFPMFNHQLEAAMEFYTATFPDSEIRTVARTGKDGPIVAAGRSGSSTRPASGSHAAAGGELILQAGRAIAGRAFPHPE